MGSQSVIIKPGLETFFVINVEAFVNFVLTVIENSDVEALLTGASQIYSVGKNFMIQSIYNPSGLLIEACEGTTSAKISYYTIPSLDPQFASDMKPTSSMGAIKSIISTT